MWAQVLGILTPHSLARLKIARERRPNPILSQSRRPSPATLEFAALEHLHLHPYVQDKARIAPLVCGRLLSRRSVLLTRLVRPSCHDPEFSENAGRLN